MTTLKNEIPTASYALLASGANFSCEVLQALRQRNYLPRLLVLPEYPPAVGIKFAHEIMQSTAPQRSLLQQAQDLKIGYAPAAQQAGCAGLIKHYAIDFLLVACWPYLIEQEVVDSVTRGALNLHPSMLPDYRGPDPITAQLADHQTHFGVSLHLLDQRFDRGDIVAQAELIEPPPNPTRSQLEQDCARLGSKLFIDALNSYDAGWRPLHQVD